MVEKYIFLNDWLNQMILVCFFILLLLFVCFIFWLTFDIFQKGIILSFYHCFYVEEQKNRLLSNIFCDEVLPPPPPPTPPPTRVNIDLLLSI